MGWHEIPPNDPKLDDYPDTAGQVYFATIENPYGQITTTTLATGYGDFKWYACESRYQTEPGKDSALHPAWRVLAWRETPQQYNPYKIDIRYHLKWLQEHLERGDTMIDIRTAMTNLTEGFEYDTGIPLLEHDRHAALFWNEEGQEESETKADYMNHIIYKLCQLSRAEWHELSRLEKYADESVEFSKDHIDEVLEWVRYKDNHKEFWETIKEL